ncbi:NXPE family member 3 isoform X2 [Syngnathus scovelli]|uniref:NXPE family member 3 isoform X2 n=1 Tax=Syngnathus scovelli TaxID=161590 RepID=UPI00210F76E0|nr:NXPE family member 3 isoform X2 [Syngnathus scovelli]
MMSLKVWKYVLSILILFGIISLLYNIAIGKNWNYNTVSVLDEVQTWSRSSRLSERLLTFQQYHTYCPHLAKPLSLEDEVEERKLLNSIIWPQLPSGSAPPSLLQTSDPVHSRFTIVTSKIKPSWYVGDQLEVQIQLRDFKGQPKRYGGDLLLARLHSPKYEAGVAGQVLDHENGLYTVRFPLLWEGSAQVDVMMVHSSEAIAVLRRLRDHRLDRVRFTSTFRQGDQSEKMMCHICLPPEPGPICNFTDVRTGEPWYCYKPKMLSCDTRYNHAMGGYAIDLLTDEETLLFQNGKNVKVPIQASTMDTINVLPSSKDKGSQKPDPVKLATSGYYYQGSWRPLDGVPMGQFNDSSAITQCLTNKSVYLYGDSTMRQWYEYFSSMLPDLKKFYLGKPIKLGPFLAVDTKHNMLLWYRIHGPPMRTQWVMSNDLRYIANELDGLTGSRDTVVALSIWAHFTTLPVEVYINRLRDIRKAVVRLLNRAPGTLVVIRTANPQSLEQDVSLYNSDWFSLQQDMVLRAMFKGLNVRFVDAWQMVVAHHEPHNLHPLRPIVKTMVDMMLSYICPHRSSNNVGI